MRIRISLRNGIVEDRRGRMKLLTDEWIARHQLECVHCWRRRARLVRDYVPEQGIDPQMLKWLCDVCGQAMYTIGGY